MRGKGEGGWLLGLMGTSLLLVLLVVTGIVPRPDTELLSLVVALATAALLLAARRLGPRRTDAALAALAVVALGGYVRFFEYHGHGVFVHAHDAGHYYLGGKYLPELGYDGLYVAMLAAEVETEGETQIRSATDLRTHELVDIEQLLARRDDVYGRFTAERWQAFKSDSARVRGLLGASNYRRFLQDHGFNATPIWALVGGALADLVPADAAGLLALALIDVGLIVAMLAALGWAFGRRTLLLSTIFLGVAFGPNFNWLGGAFLRYLWIAAAVAALACLARRRHVSAGALFAVAAGLRVFPAIFLLGTVARGADALARGRRPRSGDLRTLVAFGLTSAGLFLLSCGVYGPSLWLGFLDNLRVYVHIDATNVLGFHQAMPWLATSAPAIHTLVSVLTVVLALLLASASRRRGAVAGVALAVPMLFVLVDIAAYYALVLLLFMPAFRHRSRSLALLFATLALTWGLLEASGSLSYTLSINVFHSLLLLFVFGVVYLETLNREIRRLWTWGGRTKRAIVAAASQRRLEKYS